jgi:hypothetical protein
VAGQRPMQQPHAIAGTKFRRPWQFDAAIGWRRLMGTEKPRQLKGFEAFLLADYPYRLGCGGQSLSAACGSQTPAIRAPTSPLRR